MPHSAWNAALYFACWAGWYGCHSVAPLAWNHSSGDGCLCRYLIVATPSVRDAACNAALYFACCAGWYGCHSVAPLA